MVGVRSLRLVVVCDSFGWVLRAACIRARVHVHVCACVRLRACAYGCVRMPVRACVRGCMRLRACVSARVQGACWAGGTGGERPARARDSYWGGRVSKGITVCN